MTGNDDLRHEFLGGIQVPARFLEVGKVSGARGLKGEILILLFAGEAAWLPKLSQVYLYGMNHLTPAKQIFELEKVIPFKSGLCMKLGGVEDRTAAEKLKGAVLYIPRDFLRSTPGEKIYLAEILGFSVVDRLRGSVGEIRGFTSNGVQDLICVHYQGVDWEIPLVKEFIEDINFAAKRIEMNIPLGLLEELP